MNASLFVCTLAAIALPLILALPATAQHSCCDAPAKFAALGGSGAFRMAHKLPAAGYSYAGAGESITFSTPDGGTSTAFVVRGKTSETGGKVIVMIHEWWGLNDYIKREAAATADSLGDVTVIAVDLYDGKVAATREDAAKFMQGVSAKRAEAILRGVFAYAGAAARIGTIGWCFGGGWSLRAAIAAGAHARACVMYYGMPETDQAKLQTLSAPVLGIFAGRDKWITPAVVGQFETAAAAAGVRLAVQSYDADHAFANPSSPKFDEAARADARSRTLAFFRKYL